MPLLPSILAVGSKIVHKRQIYPSFSSSELVITMDVIAHPKTYQRATETAIYVRSMLPEVLQKPKVAIVCGSGLGGLADTIENDPKVEIPYGNIPNFPQSTGE
jgi:hypothetical protein